MRWCRLAAAVLTLCFGAAADLCAQQPGDADVVKQVLDAWQKRRKAIKAVMYKVEGVEIYGKGSMTEDDPRVHPRLRKNYPPEDVSLSTKTEYTFDFPSGKIRKERRNYILNVVLGEFCPRTSIELFDGKKATLYEPRTENTSDVYTPSAAQTELILYKGGITYMLQIDEYPMLFAHGFPTLYTKTVDVTGYFDRPIESSLFRFHDRGTIGDRACVIVRTVPEVGQLGVFDEFWVDLERDGAVLRWQASLRGATCARHEVAYRQLGGHWLPQSWQFDYFPTENGRQIFCRGERMKVTDIQIDPPLSAETFTAPRKHGMVVSDSQGGRFVIGSDDRTLVPYGQSTSVWRWWHWLGVTLFCGAILVGVIYWFRRRPRPPS